MREGVTIGERTSIMTMKEERILVKQFAIGEDFRRRVHKKPVKNEEKRIKIHATKNTTREQTERLGVSRSGMEKEGGGEGEAGGDSGRTVAGS